MVSLWILVQFWDRFPFYDMEDAVVNQHESAKIPAAERFIYAWLGLPSTPRRVNLGLGTRGWGSPVFSWIIEILNVFGWGVVWSCHFRTWSSVVSNSSLSHSAVIQFSNGTGSFSL